MPFRHGKLTEVLLDALIASPYLREASFSRGIDPAETSAFGNHSKTFIAGKHGGSITLGGMFDGAVGAVDEAFNSKVASETTYPATLFYDGGITPGRRVALAPVFKSSYDISSPVDDVVSISAELTCNSGIHQGFSLTDKVQRNASHIFPSVDWGAGSATTNGGRATIHVPHNTRNVATSVVIQHSTDNSIWVDLATQSVSASTTGSFVLEITGTINRYTRVNMTLTTGTGLVNPIVALARK